MVIQCNDIDIFKFNLIKIKFICVYYVICVDICVYRLIVDLEKDGEDWCKKECSQV